MRRNRASAAGPCAGSPGFLDCLGRGPAAAALSQQQEPAPGPDAGLELSVWTEPRTLKSLLNGAAWNLMGGQPLARQGPLSPAPRPGLPVL